MPAIYPELRGELERHRAAGDFLILASASPEFYVREIGRELGFDLTLGTVVETGPFFPPLENHKGAAKVARLKRELPASYFENGKLRHCHGYTDSRADLPMLGLCESATVVNPSPELAALALNPAGASCVPRGRGRTAGLRAPRVGASHRHWPRSRRSHSVTWKKSRMTSR